MAEISSELIDQILTEMAVDFPEHVPGTRPIHTKGIAVSGEFRATRDARDYCIAPQFDGTPIPAVVRFSNGNGQLDPDGRLQPRGMAIKLLPGDQETDLICMSVPVFMAQQVDQLLEFERAYRPTTVRRPSLRQRVTALATMCPLLPQEAGVTESGNEGFAAWSRQYPPAQGFALELSLQQLPSSYAQTVYHAVHAFEVVGDDGLQRMVRFSLEPSDAVRSVGPGDPTQTPLAAFLWPELENQVGPTLPPDYLQTEMQERLAYAPCRFNVRIQIADPFDDSADPTRGWPINRKRVLMGTLTLTEVVEDQVTGGEELSFNPGRLLPGMGPSDDPVFRQRAAVYEESYARRMAARGQDSAAS